MIKYIKNAMFITIILFYGCSNNKTFILKNNPYNLYKKIQISSKQHKYKHGIKLVKILKHYYPYNIYTQKAELNSIYFYYKLKKPKIAINIIKKLIKNKKIDNNIDYIWYMYGLNLKLLHDTYFNIFSRKYAFNRDITNIKMSYKYFNKIVNTYPNSKYSKQVKKNLINLKKNLSKYELNILKYYMERKAYIAAVNRAKKIINHYPNTESYLYAKNVIKIIKNEINLKIK